MWAVGWVNVVPCVPGVSVSNGYPSRLQRDPSLSGTSPLKVENRNQSSTMCGLSILSVEMSDEVAVIEEIN